VSRHRAARFLVYTHRWLGIALGVVFAVWFASGVVMIYARMPVLETGRRLAALPPLDPASIRVPPPQPRDGGITRLVINSLETRPVYRITAGGRTRSFYADTGDAVPPVTAQQALLIGNLFQHGVFTLHYDQRLTDADQWSFGVRGRMPLHRLRADDPAGTELYVAEDGGEVVLETTRAGRLWGGAGAVLHWLYFTPLRRLSSVWSQAIIWLSIAGTMMCVAGLAWGLWRFAPLRGYRLRRRRQWSPYARWMRWHHYAGLIFGAAATTWIFSGLLSMDPWNWHPGTSPTREQRERVAGGAVAAADLSVERLRRVLAGFAPSYPKEIDITRFRGRYYAAGAAGVVSFDAPQFGARDQLAADLVVGAASAAMPGVAIDEMAWLDRYDAYYYDRSGALSLPVLRVRYADAPHTWLYFDPRRGVIARKEERLSRLNRWLYHGLHSLDFPFLYYRRPLWDIVVIALSAGGLLLSVTTITASWRRLRRAIAASRS
jgi:hypothetical protein